MTANFSVALSVVTTFLPAATQGTPYTASLTATGGSGPYTWLINNLPPGLSLTSATGVISGTPTAVGTFTTLPVTVTDSNSVRASGNLASTNVPFRINQGTGGGAGLGASCGATPSSAQVGQVVSFSATATGATGTPNFSWSGVVSGLGSTVFFTPSSSGSFGETVTVTDSVSTRTASCSVSVQGSTLVPLTISSNSPLPYAFGGLPYAFALGATGGSGGYAWKVLGTLPAGLSLSPSGALAGAPAAGGNYAFQIEVDDSSGHSAYGQFALTVAAPQGQVAVQLATPQLGTSAGLAHQYLFHVSDAAGASDITGGQIVINASLSSPAAPPGCQLDWNSSGGLNITGVAFGSFGGTATLQGSSCTVYTSASTLTRVASGYDVSLSVALSSPLPSGILLPVWARGMSASSGAPPYSNIGAWSITLPSSGSSYSALEIDPGDLTSQPFCGTGVWGNRIGGFTPNRYKDGSMAESAGARMTGSFVPGFTNTVSNGRFYSPTFELILANSGQANSFDSDLAILMESDPASGNLYSQPNQHTGTFTHFADYQFYNPNCIVPDFDYGFETGFENVIYVHEFWEEFNVINATSDPTPQIDSISLDQQLVSGGSATLTIIGSNFGTDVGSLTFCPSSANPPNSAPYPPCNSGTNLSVSQVLAWNTGQIQATVNASLGPVGNFDVQVSSVGSGGLGFQNGSQGKGALSNQKGAIMIVSQANFTIHVTVTSGGTSSSLNANSCAYIDPTPLMPTFTATVYDLNGNIASGTATWNLNTKDQYLTRVDLPSSSTIPVIYDVNHSPTSGQASNTAAWDQTAFPIVLGGQSTIFWTFTPPGGSPQPTGSFPFKICGQNPAIADAQAYIATQQGPYWFMANIPVHETNTSQFTSSGSPILGPPAGYGMFQLDPPPSAESLWNWKTNVVQARALLDAKAGSPVDNTSNPNDGSAYPFWIRQVKQWQNENPGARLFADVVEQVSTPGSSSCTFTLSPSPSPTPASPQWTTPSTGRTGAYWFGDAVLLKQYGGLSANENANYVAWINKDTTIGEPGHWASNRSSTIVVQQAPQSHNWAYEFCTCAPGSTSCQHSSPASEVAPLPAP